MVAQKAQHEQIKKIVDFDKLPDSAFVRQPTVSMLCGGTSRAALYKWVKAGRFPAPVKLGAQTSAWNVGALRRHFAALEGA